MNHLFKSRKKPSDSSAPLKPALRSVGLPLSSPNTRPMAAPAIRRSESSSRHTDGYMSATTNTYYHRSSKADLPASVLRPSSQMGWQPPPAPPVAQRTRKSSKSRHVSAPVPAPAPIQEHVPSRHHRPPVMSTRLRTASTPAQRTHLSHIHIRKVLTSIHSAAKVDPETCRSPSPRFVSVYVSFRLVLICSSEIIELTTKGKDAGYWSDGPLSACLPSFLSFRLC
jgi:hypothetical protein